MEECCSSDKPGLMIARLANVKPAIRAVTRRMRRYGAAVAGELACRRRRHAFLVNYT